MYMVTCEFIANPRFLRAKERKLARTQREFSRKAKGSANRAKARRRVAAVHRKVRETRLDYAHKTALRLVRDNQAVYAEDLFVAGLARSRLAKSVTDAGWSQLIRCIEEKAARYGRTFAEVGLEPPEVVDMLARPQQHQRGACGSVVACADGVTHAHEQAASTLVVAEVGRRHRAPVHDRVSERDEPRVQRVQLAIEVLPTALEPGRGIGHLAERGERLPRPTDTRGTADERGDLLDPEIARGAFGEIQAEGIVEPVGGRIRGARRVRGLGGCGSRDRLAGGGNDVLRPAPERR
jgi:IS605 OrfB family transposase